MIIFWSTAALQDDVAGLFWVGGTAGHPTKNQAIAAWFALLMIGNMDVTKSCGTLAMLGSSGGRDV